MKRDDAAALVERYLEAFNAGDTAAMLALLDEGVEHHVNQGGVRRGHAAFSGFCAHMAACYSEQLRDIVVMTSADGSRAAAEFTVHGAYLKTDDGLPEARGQRYVLPAGSFFSLRDGRITRISTAYNLNDWIAQVSA